MERKLEGKRIAVLVDKGFEQVELTGPVQALKDAGAMPSVVSGKSTVKAWNFTDWGTEYKTNVLLDEADPSIFDALLLPGGVMNPDKLRVNPKAVQFVRHFTESGKPIASICHGPWTLIETGFVMGKTMTSFPSIKTDLINAGANWVDEEVVVDNGLVTSRKPDDLPAFNKKMIEEFAEGIHRRSAVSNAQFKNFH
jgi:protease I